MADEPIRGEYNLANDPPEDVKEFLDRMEGGPRLAEQLVEHIASEGAAGFSMEVERNEEVWNVDVKFLGKISDVKKLVE